MPLPSAPHPTALASTAPELQHFELTVQPESAACAWHAQLWDMQGQRLDFSSPIELLRHLTRLSCVWTEGGLK